MKLDDSLARHLHTFFQEYLTSQRNVSPHTILAYRDSLKLLLRFASDHHGKPVDTLAIQDVDVETVLAFLRHLEVERKNSLSTRNARLAALHAFYRHVAARDPGNLLLCQRVLAVPAKRTPHTETRYLEREEVEALLGQVDRSKAGGRRDYALLSFIYQTGVRVAECIGVRACDLQLGPLPQVRIWGKGRKERLIPLWDSTAALLREWIVERGIDPRGAAALFVNAKGQPLTRWGISYILKKYARAASVTAPTLAAKGVHPHMMRHTTAVHLLDAGAEPNVIRDLLGHSSAETTWRYTRIRMERKRRLIEASMRSASTGKPRKPIWHRDSRLLEQLEAIGCRPAYVERGAP